MDYTQNELLEIQGFKNGYVMADKSKALQDKIIKLHHNEHYLKGFVKGIEQHTKDLQLIFPSSAKLEKRQAKLKHIAQQEKNRERDEHER